MSGSPIIPHQPNPHYAARQIHLFMIQLDGYASDSPLLAPLLDVLLRLEPKLRDLRGPVEDVLRRIEQPVNPLP